ncbi:MAG: hypothetical protein V3U06_03035 [Candidatus Binatia bacterium]
MNKFRAFLWTSILGGSLLVSSGSALANSGHGHRGASYHKHRFQLVRVYRNHRGEIMKAMRFERNHFGVKGHYVRRRGYNYWVSGHRSLPPRYWKRAHRRGAWGHRPMRRVPRTVIIEREVEVERETPSIQIGPEELSVIIPLPW